MFNISSSYGFLKFFHCKGVDGLYAGVWEEKCWPLKFSLCGTGELEWPLEFLHH